jgi:hypothetical protein
MICRLHDIGTLLAVAAWFHEKDTPHHGPPREDRITSPVAIPPKGTPRCVFVPAYHQSSGARERITEKALGAFDDAVTPALAIPKVGPGLF